MPGGKVLSEEGTCKQRGKMCVESFRREVWKGGSVAHRDSGLLSPEEGESLVLCLKNPEEACVALLLPSYITV